MILSVLIVNDTRVDRHHGCSAVMQAIVRLLARNGVDRFSFLPAHSDWRKMSDFRRFVSDFDLVLVNAEGTIHHDREAGLRLLEIGGVTRSLGVRSALVNAGWEGNSPSLLSLLRNFDFISARDTRSAVRMRASGEVVRVVPDLSIWAARDEGFRPLRCNRDIRKLGVTDNVDRFKSLFLEKLRHMNSGQSVSIGYAAKGTKGRLSFIRDGISIREDFSNPYRLVALLKMRNRLWKSSQEDLHRFIQEISGFSLLVSGRFHACTLALSVGTPIIALPSNTDKIAALFEDAGLDSWRYESVIDSDHIQRAKEAQWSDAEYQSLCAYLESASVLTEEMFSDLAKLMRSK
jgi:hypothetical protein